MCRTETLRGDPAGSAGPLPARDEESCQSSGGGETPHCKERAGFLQGSGKGDLMQTNWTLIKPVRESIGDYYKPIGD